MPQQNMSIHYRVDVVLAGTLRGGRSTLPRFVAGPKKWILGDTVLYCKATTDAPPVTRSFAMALRSDVLCPLMALLKNIAFPLGMAKMGGFV